MVQDEPIRTLQGIPSDAVVKEALSSHLEIAISEKHVSVSHLEVEGTGFQAERRPGPRLKSEIVLAMLVLRNSKDAGEAGRSKRGQH